MLEEKRNIQEIIEELERVKKDLEIANQKLELYSRIDALTGVYNRLVFESALLAEWQRCKRYLIPLSLIMIDIDFFNAFNEYYGFHAGDDCLKQVASALKECARRSSDTVSRVSGDEFAIIVPHLNRDYAFILAGIIRDKIMELGIPHAVSSASNILTISIGIHTVIPDDQLLIEDFVKVAGIALYEAKKEHNSIIIE